MMRKSPEKVECTDRGKSRQRRRLHFNIVAVERPSILGSSSGMVSSCANVDPSHSWKMFPPESLRVYAGPPSASSSTPLLPLPPRSVTLHNGFALLSSSRMTIFMRALKVLRSPQTVGTLALKIYSIYSIPVIFATLLTRSILNWSLSGLGRLRLLLYLFVRHAQNYRLSLRNLGVDLVSAGHR